MKKTFAELQQTPDVSPQDVIDTLRDYSETGAAIIAGVVTEILGRTQFSVEQMKELLEAAQTGVATHRGMSHTAGFQHVPPEIIGVAMRQSAWLEVLDYGAEARSAKQDAEIQEADNFQSVVNFVADSVSFEF